MRDEPDGLPREALLAELAALRRAHAALVAAQEPIVEALPTMVWVGDAAGNCHYVNPAWLRFRGTQLADEQGQGWVAGVHPDDREACLGGYQSTASVGGETRMEYRLLRHDGEWRWMLDRCGPQRGPGDDVIRYVGTVTDITEQVESRALLDKVNAAKRVESLGLLAGGVAHDFNNLLVGILGNVELALEDVGPGHPAHACLEDVVLAARSASEMTTQLLTYAGRRRIGQDEFDLNAVVQATLATEPQVRRGDLRLELAPDLPALRGDAGLIGQAVAHLLRNAAQSTEGTRGRIEIRTWLEPDGRVALDVADNGTGMDASTRARIFEPYYTTREMGRGLGLATVHGIVARHGGSIEVDAAPGAGARFTVRFARLAEGPVPIPPARRSAPAARIGAVLLVDDDPRVLRASRRILERRGFVVVAAQGGRAALAELDHHGQRIAAVVLDLTMPDLDGAEVLRRIREVRPELPVVLASGYAHEDVFRRIEPADVRGFLHKPFTPTGLEDAVRKALAIED